MNLPQFNAEASLGPALGIYGGKAVYGRLGAVEVLPMLPKRPTVDTPTRCFIGAGESGCEGLICWCCYSDGCWICDHVGGFPRYDNCVWDDAYRAQPVGPPRPLGVFTGGVFETGGGLGTGGVFETGGGLGTGGVFQTGGGFASRMAPSPRAKR